MVEFRFEWLISFVSLMLSRLTEKSDGAVLQQAEPFVCTPVTPKAKSRLK